ncbi:hypothetical protein IG631_10255 [Alternaria alternata]|nr:hypothetical protein IG631_10255 [Alternaria alternata]
MKRWDVAQEENRKGIDSGASIVVTGSCPGSVGGSPSSGWRLSTGNGDSAKQIPLGQVTSDRWLQARRRRRRANEERHEKRRAKPAPWQLQGGEEHPITPRLGQYPMRSSVRQLHKRPAFLFSRVLPQPAGVSEPPTR